MIAAIGICSPVAMAVDVGCGTGQSTLALLPIAKKVIGIDISPEMLKHVPIAPNIFTIQAEAEKLPVRNSCADLITAGLAYHWFDKPQFLAECHRVLHPEGWLVIYSSVFKGESESHEYTQWHKKIYERRFPLPKREASLVDLMLANKHGLIDEKIEHYTSTIQFALPIFVEYLGSRTNVLAAIQRGETTSDQVFTDIYHDLKGIFRDKALSFTFTGDIQYLRNT